MVINLGIKDLNDSNRKEKFLKAIKEISTIMQVPATIEHKEHEKEDFPFKAQEELYNRYKERFGLLMDDLYSRVCRTLDIRPVNTFRKAIDPNAPKLGKEILWNPETGQPITQKEMNRLLNAIDKFINRNVGPMQKEFTISQAAVGRILGRLRENNSFDVLRDKPLDELKAKDKRWDLLTNYAELNDFSPNDYSRLKFRERVVGNYIQDINDSTRKRIRDVLDQGFLAGKTKGELSQELFDKFGSLNKDWDRIVDTEGVNIFNAEFIDEQKKDVLPGEMLYFIRRESADNKTCSFCIKATQQQIIARWSDVPLQDENIKDPVASIAVWSGKTNYGRSRADWWWAEAGIHPYCYSDDAEVLTDTGWKLFKDVLPLDKIMSINPDTREIDYLNHKGLISYKFEGMMVYFHGKKTDLLVTPDHSMIYSLETGLEKCSAQELVHSWVSIPGAEIGLEVRGKHNIVIPSNLDDPCYVDKSYYNGMVYDVELIKWHFLLVKRNGKLAWSGNCRGAWDRYFEEIGDIEL